MAAQACSQVHARRSSILPGKKPALTGATSLRTQARLADATLTALSVTCSVWGLHAIDEWGGLRPFAFYSPPMLSSAVLFFAGRCHLAHAHAHATSGILPRAGSRLHESPPRPLSPADPFDNPPCMPVHAPRWHRRAPAATGHVGRQHPRCLSDGLSAAPCRRVQGAHDELRRRAVPRHRSTLSLLQGAHMPRCAHVCTSHFPPPRLLPTPAHTRCAPEKTECPLSHQPRVRARQDALQH